MVIVRCYNCFVLFFVFCFFNVILLFFLISGRDSFVVNQEFEGLTINDMTDLSCSNWVHHVQYILPQVKNMQNMFSLHRHLKS